MTTRAAAERVAGSGLHHNRTRMSERMGQMRPIESQIVFWPQTKMETLGQPADIAVMATVCRAQHVDQAIAQAGLETVSKYGVVVSIVMPVCLGRHGERKQD